MKDKYETISNGWINKNDKITENPKLPVLTGWIELEKPIGPGQKINIALWERNGAYSFKITRHNEDE